MACRGRRQWQLLKAQLELFNRTAAGIRLTRPGKPVTSIPISATAGSGLLVDPGRWPSSGRRLAFRSRFSTRWPSRLTFSGSGQPGSHRALSPKQGDHGQCDPPGGRSGHRSGSPGDQFAIILATTSSPVTKAEDREAMIRPAKGILPVRGEAVDHPFRGGGHPRCCRASWMQDRRKTL